ncbi:UbiA prenyltransferase family protein [Streptomyces sp. NPDC127068]|uniref:UbiA prenyltransferase family protein n=1 Tax=Streptomyces sp. NPDC127068 TaxID=3347127 RepID=UPI003649EA2E
MSLAQPGGGMLLATGCPDPRRLGWAALAGAAGFLAVFAANDLLDVRLDRRRVVHLHPLEGPDLDSTGGRHPIAEGRLRLVAGVLWVLALGAFALIVSAVLSRVCVTLFLCAVLLQVLYCRLATVTPYKFLLSGVLVVVGAWAGWFAFSDAVDPLRLGLFGLWMFAWEIGGRNIPNDLSDLAEDTPLGVRTLPVVLGPRRSARVAFVFLVIAAGAGCALAVAAWPSFGLVGLLGMALSALFTLLGPGARLLRSPEPQVALRTFNRASFHPVCVLVAFGFAVAV